MRMFCAFFTASALLCWAATKGTPEDERAIRQVIADYTAAFNRHEANFKTIALADDFDLVNPAGAQVTGKAEIESRLRDAFRTFLKNARKIETIDRIRFIHSEVALVDGRFEWVGSEMKPDPKGFECVVLTAAGRSQRPAS